MKLLVNLLESFCVGGYKIGDFFCGEVVVFVWSKM